MTGIPPGQPLPPEHATQGGVIRAEPADLDVLSQVIAEAFHPLAPSIWLVPGPANRQEIFPGYFRIYVEHAMTNGVVHTTPGRTAAALWLPIGQGGAGPPAGYHERLVAVTSPWTDRFLAFDAALDQHHLAGVAHHHLAILAVRPDCQGRGTGTALLRAYHQILDNDARVPAYLEASDLRTRQIYLRHGYADQGPPIRLPSGPQMYPMVRPCHPAATTAGGSGERTRPPDGKPVRPLPRRIPEGAHDDAR